MRAFFSLLVLAATAACSLPDERDLGSASPERLALGAEAAAARGPFESCILELASGEEPAVRVQVQRAYRLSEDDAHDLVRDALITICVRHATSPYQNLGAALQKAATNRARDGWRHRRRYPACPIDGQVPACDPWLDENARFDQEQRAIEAAFCAEDRISERIIRVRVMEEQDFATIGREHGLSADQARAMFHNALKRVKKRAADACGIRPTENRPPAYTKR